MVWGESVSKAKTMWCIFYYIFIFCLVRNDDWESGIALKKAWGFWVAARLGLSLCESRAPRRNCNLADVTQSSHLRWSHESHVTGAPTPRHPRWILMRFLEAFPRLQSILHHYLHQIILKTYHSCFLGLSSSLTKSNLAQVDLSTNFMGLVHL